MKLLRLRVSVIALAIVFLFGIPSLATVQSQCEVESIEVKVYRDGLTHITQTVIVDEFLPEIILPLLSTTVENLIVLDENQLAVDYQQSTGNLTVFTLGAPCVSIEYDTVALTSKEAEVWTLSMNNPYSLTVSLPSNSTIVYLSHVPAMIDATSPELSLALYPGQWELSYIVPLVPPDQNGATPWAGIPVVYVIAGIVVVLAVVLMVVLFVRQRRKVNVKKILSRNPTLMPDDKEVIEFLAQNDGKAFEAEIRAKFPDMPRTSLWRLVRRLEGLEIVEVKKIGLENQVKLKK